MVLLELVDCDPQCAYTWVTVINWWWSIFLLLIVTFHIFLAYALCSPFREAFLSLVEHTLSLSCTRKHPHAHRSYVVHFFLESMPRQHRWNSFLQACDLANLPMQRTQTATPSLAVWMLPQTLSFWNITDKTYDPQEKKLQDAKKVTLLCKQNSFFFQKLSRLSLLFQQF